MKRWRIITLITIGLITAFLLFRYLFFPYKIGIIFSTQTEIGFEHFIAARIWAREHSSLSLRRIHYYFENPSLRASDIRKSYKKLADSGVSIIIGGAISREGVVLQKEAVKYRIPTISVTTASHHLDGKKDPFLKMLFSTKLQGRYMADYLVEKKARRIAVISETMNSKYSGAFANTIIKHLPDSVYRETFVLPMDKTKWNRLAQLRPDWTVIILPSHQILKVIRYLNSRHIDTEYLSGTWGVYKLADKIYNRENKKITVMSHFSSIPKKHLKLYKIFRNSQPIKPNREADDTFTTLDFTIKAIRLAGSSRENILKYFNKEHDIRMGENIIHLNKFGDAIPRFIYYKKFRNGRLVIIRKIETKNILRGNQ